MDMTAILSQLSALDPNVLKLCAAVLGALAILSLIKRAVKLGIFIAVLAVGSALILPAVQDFQEKYSVSVENDQLIMVIDGQELRLGAGNIKSMSLEKDAAGAYVVRVVYKDTQTPASIQIPAFMRGVVGEYIKRNYPAAQAGG